MSILGAKIPKRSWDRLLVFRNNSRGRSGGDLLTACNLGKFQEKLMCDSVSIKKVTFESKVRQVPIDMGDHLTILVVRNVTWHLDANEERCVAAGVFQ